MADNDPRRPSRKLLIGVLLIALGAAAVVALSTSGDGRRTPPPDAATPAPAPEPAVAPPSAAPVPPAPTSSTLNRAALLDAAASAAAAYSAGAAPPPELAALDGRRFALTIPFGCDGPDESGTAPEGWSIGPAGETLRITVRPEAWTSSPFAQALGGGEAEAVEGFWIPRPWQRTETCPPRPADPLAAEAPLPSPQTVGLATVYGRGSSRLGRRGDRPFELTLPLANAARPGPQGLQLVVEGRMTAFADGRTAACQAASPEQRPVCLIGAAVERVAIRNPATGRVLGEWREAGPVTAPGPAAPPQGSAAPTPSG